MAMTLDDLQLEELLDGEPLCEINHIDFRERYGTAPTCAIVATFLVRYCDGEMVIVCRPLAELVVSGLRQFGTACNVKHYAPQVCFEVNTL